MKSRDRVVAFSVVVAVLSFLVWWLLVKISDAHQDLYPSEKASSSPEKSDTLAIIARKTALPMPTPPVGFPTPQPPSTNMYQTYLSVPEMYIGKYVIRSWAYMNYPSAYGNAVTIDSIGMTQISKSSAKLNPLTGVDLTKDGIPEAVIEIHTGGNACCHGIAVYSLGDELKTLLDVPTGECVGRFADLDGNGTYEYVTCDGSYNGVFDKYSTSKCGRLGSPHPTVIFEYNSQMGRYEVATSRFFQISQRKIDDYIHTLDDVSGEPPLCLVAGLVMEYLYAGRHEQAWMALTEYYSAEEVGFYRQVIEDEIRARALFPPLP